MFLHRAAFEMKPSQVFEQLVKTEQSALTFLRGLCWENHDPYCVRCHSERLYRIAGERYRCKRCRYTFHDFSGRWISKCRINPQTWLRIVKLFEEEQTTQSIAREVALSYPTVLNAMKILRLAVIANSADADRWLAHIAPFGRKQLGRQESLEKIAVFGIRETQGAVVIDLLDDFPVAKFKALKPKMLRRSAVFYSTAYQSYLALVFHNHWPRESRRSKEELNVVYRLEEESEFWRFAEDRMVKFRGVLKNTFPYYLKELEYRFNCRERAIFDSLCRFLVSFIPEWIIDF
jgi:transposase